MIDSPEIFKALETSPLFHGVPEKLLAQNLSQSSLCSLKPGEVLLDYGQANNQIYVILSGRVNIQARKTDTEPVAMLGEGECVGEMAVLGDEYASAYVVAATDCELLAINYDALWRLIDSSHAAARNMLSVLSKRVRLTDQAQTENIEHESGFSGVSVTDELTGLYNQEWVQKKFDRLLQRSFFAKTPSCLLLLEMDGYWQYCDENGQLGGEQALRDVAYNILFCLRPDDHAGRYIGEQFAIYLPGTSVSDACIAAERLKAAINNSTIVLPSGDALPAISVSMGISQAYPTSDTLDNLFSRAEEALQRAKSSGGNCIECT